jgi:methylaspartate ammonia-lyase
VEVEGEAAEIAGFIASIEERMQGFIRKIERSVRTGSREFRGFTIK